MFSFLSFFDLHSTNSLEHALNANNRNAFFYHCFLSFSQFKLFKLKIVPFRFSSFFSLQFNGKLQRRSDDEKGEKKKISNCVQIVIIETFNRISLNKCVCVVWVDVYRSASVCLRVSFGLIRSVHKMVA